MCSGHRCYNLCSVGRTSRDCDCFCASLALSSNVHVSPERSIGKENAAVEGEKWSTRRSGVSSYNDVRSTGAHACN